MAEDETTMIRLKKPLRDEIRLEAHLRGQTMELFVDKALTMAVNKARAARINRERWEREGR